MFFESLIFNKRGKAKLPRPPLLGFESRKWMIGMRVVKMSKNRYSSHLLLVHVYYNFHQVSAVWPVKVTSSMTGCQ